MISLSRGQVSSPSAPALIFVSQVVGQAVPAQALGFKIFDASTPELEANPNQIYPGSGYQPVDLVNDLLQSNTSSGYVAGLDAMNTGAGFYVARWTVPSNAPTGRYLIEWQFLLTNPSDTTATVFNSENPPSGIVRKSFEVLGASSAQSSLALSAYNAPQSSYSLVTDARAFLNCDIRDVSDVALKRLIQKASAMIERITGRYFEPRYQTMRLGGNSSRKLEVGSPIIAISSVGIDTEPTQSGDLVVELDLLRIYNRHLSQGMLEPDDRQAPMLEFVHSDDLYGIRFVPFRGISLRSLAWPIGVQNVHVRGFFGFTDPDGSPWGEVPELIQHVCRLICAREVHKVGTDKREDAQWRWRVTSEKARDVQIDMVEPRKWGEWFGDPEIDSVLASYVRPPRLGST